jgi:hypothetical protein
LELDIKGTVDYIQKKHNRLNDLIVEGANMSAVIENPDPIVDKIKELY